MMTEHAIVTGAASGIGREAVRRLRGRHAEVTAVDLSTDLLDVYQNDEGVCVITGDVTNPEFAESVVAQAEKRSPVTHMIRNLRRSQARTTLNRFVCPRHDSAGLVSAPRTSSESPHLSVREQRLCKSPTRRV
jgi:NAD(P)-dependent dehydrogenase (short-subunit alcohol dehydrogenase family)